MQPDFVGAVGPREETKPEGEAERTNIYLQKSKVHMIQALYTVVKTGLFYVFLLPERKHLVIISAIFIKCQVMHF